MMRNSFMALIIWFLLLAVAGIASVADGKGRRYVSCESFAKKMYEIDFRLVRMSNTYYGTAYKFRHSFWGARTFYYRPVGAPKVPDYWKATFLITCKNPDRQKINVYIRSHIH